MTWEWKIGDPVDDATGGSMDAMNWGHGSDEDSTWEPHSTNTKIKQYADRAWDLYMDYREEEALDCINIALDLDDMNSNNWNRKAIILEALERFKESEDCYNRSLKLARSRIVSDNKARMLYDWASQMLEESRKLPPRLNILYDSLDTVMRAMNSIPDGSEEDPDRYLRLKESVEFYIDYQKEYLKNIEILKGYPKEELFTIAGRNFYKNGVNLTSGMALRLVREPYNEFDHDAIAVFAGGEKVGYVANNEYTKYESTSSASQLAEGIQGVCQAEFLLHLEWYSEIQFLIGRIIR